MDKEALQENLIQLETEYLEKELKLLREEITQLKQAIEDV